jgi:hypothetical protein
MVRGDWGEWRVREAGLIPRDSGNEAKNVLGDAQTILDGLCRSTYTARLELTTAVLQDEISA